MRFASLVDSNSLVQEDNTFFIMTRLTDGHPSPRSSISIIIDHRVVTRHLRSAFHLSIIALPQGSRIGSSRDGDHNFAFGASCLWIKMASVGWNRFLTLQRSVFKRQPACRLLVIAAGLLQETACLSASVSSSQVKTTYYTCRHTYEDTLMEELELLTSCPTTSLWSPCPGLVGHRHDMNTEPTRQQDRLLDPVYALQILPNAALVTAPSAKALATQALEELLSDDGHDDVPHSLHELLRAAPRGSLAVHAMVPAMLKGSPKPPMLGRVRGIADSAVTILKKSFPCARKSSNTDHDEEEKEGTEERWLLQLLLLEPNKLIASLSQCKDPCNVLQNSKDDNRKQLKDSVLHQSLLWPNWHYPAGLASVDLEDIEMPSSAYRKLLESMACLNRRPSGTSAVAYDLGASPGGWTMALRLANSEGTVVAIDRSKLAPELMNDPNIQFIKGDAFAFEPAQNQRNSDVWMVSDVIAQPERAVELVNEWCLNKWANVIIVTIKFRGEINWEALQNAKQAAQRHGYEYCRVKHFFNNKNEVSLMISRTPVAMESCVPANIPPLFPVHLPLASTPDRPSWMTDSNVGSKRRRPPESTAPKNKRQRQSPGKTRTVPTNENGPRGNRRKFVERSSTQSPPRNEPR